MFEASPKSPIFILPSDVMKTLWGLTSLRGGGAACRVNQRDVVCDGDAVEYFFHVCTRGWKAPCIKHRQGLGRSATFGASAGGACAGSRQRMTALTLRKLEASSDSTGHTRGGISETGVGEIDLCIIFWAWM